MQNNKSGTVKHRLLVFFSAVGYIIFIKISMQIRQNTNIFGVGFWNRHWYGQGNYIPCKKDKTILTNVYLIQQMFIRLTSF